MSNKIPLSRLNIEKHRIKLELVNYYEVEGNTLLIWMDDETEVKKFVIQEPEKMKDITDKIEGFWDGSRGSISV